MRIETVKERIHSVMCDIEVRIETVVVTLCFTPSQPIETLKEKSHSVMCDVLKF